MTVPRLETVASSPCWVVGRDWIDLVVQLDSPLRLSFPVSKHCPSLVVALAVVKRMVGPSSSFVELVVVVVFHMRVAAADNPLVVRIAVLVNWLAHNSTYHHHLYELEEEEVLTLGDPCWVIQVQEVVHSNLVEEGRQVEKEDHQSSH